MSILAALAIPLALAADPSPDLPVRSQLTDVAAFLTARPEPQPDQQKAAAALDALGQDWDTNRTRAQKDGQGRVTHVVGASGLVTKLSYGAADRITGISLKTARGESLTIAIDRAPTGAIQGVTVTSAKRP